MNNKPNSMKIHEFNPVIYPYKVWIVIDKTPAGIADINNKEMGDERYLLEYEEYKQYRLQCKQLAEEIITNI